MGFKLVVCPPTKETHYSKPPDLNRLRTAVPGVEVYPVQTRGELLEAIEDADAALGYVPPEALQRAKSLRWVACPVAGPAAGFYHQALIESGVVVTNVRGIYSDQISVHIMAFVLAFAKALRKASAFFGPAGAPMISVATMKSRFGSIASSAVG